jgi:hypothetical protein
MASTRPRVAGALLAALLTAACTAEKSADPAAVTAVRSQICTLAADGTLTEPEVRSLGRVLDRAHQLGLPDEILTPSHEIVTAGKATPEKTAELRTACA